MVAATKTAGAVPSSERQLLGRADLNKREIQEITMTAIKRSAVRRYNLCARNLGPTGETQRPAFSDLSGPVPGPARAEAARNDGSYNDLLEFGASRR
jgi:hypothetical protein